MYNFSIRLNLMTSAYLISPTYTVVGTSLLTRGVYFYLFGYMHSRITSEILVSCGKSGIFADQIHTKYFQVCIQIFRQYIHSIEILYFFRINDRYEIYFAIFFWVFMSLSMEFLVWKWFFVVIDDCKELDCQTFLLHTIHFKYFCGRFPTDF